VFKTIQFFIFCRKKRKPEKNDEMNRRKYMDKYASYYSEEAFWEKIRQEGRNAGTELCHKAFILFYILKRELVPKSIKEEIKEALGYFICPHDVIPDFAPAVGYNDDMDRLMQTWKTVSEYADEEIMKKALAAMKERFPEEYK
jgi:uncharacterized membrane protein YkvA (DUF1232 family)